MSHTLPYINKMIFLQPPTVMKSFVSWMKQSNNHPQATQMNAKAAFCFLQGLHASSSTETSTTFTNRRRQKQQHPLSSSSSSRRQRRLLELQRDSPTLLTSSDSIALFVSDECLDMETVGAFQSMLVHQVVELSELKLTNLTFDNNKTQQAFEEAVVRGLAHHSTLKMKRLSLRNCGITDQLAVHLAAALENNTLEFLDLSGNKFITKRGIVALLSATTTTTRRSNHSHNKPPRLETLRLDNTGGITTETIKEMIALNHLSESRLKHLSMHSLELLLTPASWDAVSSAVSGNFALQSLVMGSFSMSAVTAEDECDALALWCAPNSMLQALEALKYYLRRNRMANRTRRTSSSRLVQTVQWAQRFEREGKQFESSANTANVFDRSSVLNERFALSLIFDVLRENPVEQMRL